MNPIVTKELIFSYFMGNVSAIQRQTIAQWAREKANEEQLYRWLEEFETLHPEYDADLENAVRNYYTFLADSEQSADPGIQIGEIAGLQSAVTRRLWLKRCAVAGVVLLLGIFSFLNRDLWQLKAYTTRIGERKDFLLPDGSSVRLGSNSILKVPRWGFGSESRDVYLSGEAFFSVRHMDASRRFIVKTAKRFEVEVLGTEFNVVARDAGSRVILKKGKVQLNFPDSHSGKKVDLRPGDVFTLDNKNQASLKTTTVPELREAWQGHLYIFDQTSLSEIMGQLEEEYGIKAEFTDRELAGHTISGKFTAESIDELFELIQGILAIRITRQGDSVTISQPGL